jgi:hypothetical protein
MNKKYLTRNGFYEAKVIYIGDQPVIVYAEHKNENTTTKRSRPHRSVGRKTRADNL